MSEALYRRRIHDLLSSQNVITFSFCDDDGPWSTPVYFAADNLKLIIASHVESRHAKAIKAGHQFSASIHAPNDNWIELCGLQMVGSIEQAAASDLERRKATYIEHFPFTKILFDQSENDIGMDIGKMEFYIFSPTRIVLTDNRISFGFKWEYRP
jgi:uncharacterized protein YhbP (UPF0306 family)